MKKEFKMEIEDDAKDNQKDEERIRQIDQKRSSNLLTAILLLVEELSPYDKQILRKELDK